MSLAARADETIGANFVLLPLVRNDGRLRHTGPEKMMSAFSAMAVLDHVCEVGHGHHDIDADDAFGLFTGFAQLFAQAPDACRIVVFGVFPVDDAQSGRGDHSHTRLGWLRPMRVPRGRCLRPYRPE